MAYEIATKRNDIAKKIGRANGRFFEGYQDLEANWQGAIGELMIEALFPTWKTAQPMIINGINTLNTDFVTSLGNRIEVKCNRFYKNYSIFFINALRVEKKPFDYMVCTTINDTPAKADNFSIIGCITLNEIKMNPIDTTISSPAYMVPINDIYPELEGI